MKFFLELAGVLRIVSSCKAQHPRSGCCVCVCAAALKGAKKKKHPDRKLMPDLKGFFGGMSPKDTKSITTTPRAMLYHYRKKKRKLLCSSQHRDLPGVKLWHSGKFDDFCWVI